MERETEVDAGMARTRYRHSKVRRKRGLTDEIFVAFHQACDERDNDIALALVRVLDFMAARTPILSNGEVPRMQQSVVAANQRLWEIRHS